MKARLSGIALIAVMISTAWTLTFGQGAPQAAPAQGAQGGVRPSDGVEKPGRRRSRRRWPKWRATSPAHRHLDGLTEGSR